MYRDNSEPSVPSEPQEDVNNSPLSPDEALLLITQGVAPNRGDQAGVLMTLVNIGIKGGELGTLLTDLTHTPDGRKRLEAWRNHQIEINQP